MNMRLLLTSLLLGCTLALPANAARLKEAETIKSLEDKEALNNLARS